MDNRKNIWALTLVILAGISLALVMSFGVGEARVAFKVGQAGNYVSMPPLEEKSFPQELSGTQLIKLISGDEAQQAVNQLHGTEINLEKCYIAIYQGNETESMVVWVSQSRTPLEAQQLLKVMNEKLPSNEYFTNYKVLNVAGQTFYFTNDTGGMGAMDHYYFLKGNRVYWVSVLSPDSLTVAKEVFDKI